MQINYAIAMFPGSGQNPRGLSRLTKVEKIRAPINETFKTNILKSTDDLDNYKTRPIKTHTAMNICLTMTTKKTGRRMNITEDPQNKGSVRLGTIYAIIDSLTMLAISQVNFVI